uniref:(California timema) hypothetical protein n=1 Tax=Timema californicum TaxID=61474 RepID=A0A7R9JD66_TIMCA|nr:unnamed protein product [Timema californicum]
MRDELAPLLHLLGAALAAGSATILHRCARQLRASKEGPALLTTWSRHYFRTRLDFRRQEDWGVKIVFKVALVLLKFSLGRAGVLKKCPTMYETLEVLRNPPQAIMEEEFLINQMHRLNLTEEDFEYEHRRQMAKRRAAQLENKKIIRR